MELFVYLPVLGLMLIGSAYLLTKSAGYRTAGCYVKAVWPVLWALVMWLVVGGLCIFYWWQKGQVCP